MEKQNPIQIEIKENNPHSYYNPNLRKIQKLEGIDKDACKFCGKKKLCFYYVFWKLTAGEKNLLFGRRNLRLNDFYAYICDSCNVVNKVVSDKELSRKYRMGFDGKHKDALEEPKEIELKFLNAEVLNEVLK